MAVSDDERDARGALPDDLQGRESVEGRQGVIGQDQVEAPAFERGDERRAVRDHLKRAVHAARLEGGPDQLHVVRVVLDVQDPQPSAGSGPRFGKRRFHRAQGARLTLPGGGWLSTPQNNPRVFTASMNSRKSTGLTT